MSESLTKRAVLELKKREGNDVCADCGKPGELSCHCLPPFRVRVLNYTYVYTPLKRGAVVSTLTPTVTHTSFPKLVFFALPIAGVGVALAHLNGEKRSIICYSLCLSVVRMHAWCLL